MTRIIAGSAKGRSLRVPRSGTRPTADRVRESVFSSLDHQLGGWQGVRVLDLFAGSGAFGLEALSRGAESAVLVDLQRSAVQACRSNAAATRLNAEVVGSDAVKYVRQLTDRQFDLVFADPPYDLPEATVGAVLRSLVDTDALAQDAVVLVERARSAEPANWPEGFGEIRERRIGDTLLRSAVWYVH